MSNTTEAIHNLEVVRNSFLTIEEASSALNNLLSLKFTLKESVNIIDNLSFLPKKSPLKFKDAVISAIEGVESLFK